MKNSIVLVRRKKLPKTKSKEKRFRNLPVIHFGLDYLPPDLINGPPDLDDTDDDSTVSSCSTVPSVKCVSFATSEVTDVWYRPRTHKKDKKKLYYTVEETARFRQEYREERIRSKQKDPETPSELGEPCADDKSSGDSQGKSDQAKVSDHRITKVVVKHKNTLETFIDKEMDPKKDKSLAGKFKTANDDFFDNDSFWNGQITWY